MHGCTTVIQIHEAQGFWQRFVGLMFSQPRPYRHALLLRQCSGVHTCFMRYPLDMVFLDTQGVVVKLAPAVQPWRFCLGGRTARHVLEMQVDSIAVFGLRLGDQLSLANISESFHARPML